MVQTIEPIQAESDGINNSACSSKHKCGRLVAVFLHDTIIVKSFRVLRFDIFITYTIYLKCITIHVQTIVIDLYAMKEAIEM